MKVRALLLIFFFLIQASFSYSKDFIITDFGARQGKLSTSSILKAVDECHTSGGRNVVIPAGTYLFQKKI